MQLTITRASDSAPDADTAVLAVAGSVDVASRDRLVQAVTDALDGGAKSIVLVLTDVSFMDSTGIGALIDVAGSVDDAGGRFAIRDPSRPVTRLLDVAGLGGRWSEGPAA